MSKVDQALFLINIALSIIILWRVLFYAKPQGTSHRIVIAIIAYAICIAAGAELIKLVFFSHPSTLECLLYKTLLTIALLASKGNVVDLFMSRYTNDLIEDVARAYRPLPPRHIAPRRKPREQ